ncbi:MAG TPA: sensor domain-containing protein [Thermoanaerobaculia bacterium]|nr:sensor domain-containing protein [Thermoanaerobaculia bacterium]
MDIDDKDSQALSHAVAGFFLAPVRVRTYTNLLYLALAFPVGIGYFIFLTVGLALGFGLTILWIGLPILALVFAGSWGLAALERQLAIHLLGADVPPMSPPVAAVGEPVGFWRTIGEFLGNPVTWKGMAFLLLKLPLGIVSFIMAVALLSISGGLAAAPFLYPWEEITIDLFFWSPDSFADYLLCGAAGVVLLVVALNLLNGLAFLWRQLAVALLGSERFATPAEPTGIPEAAVAA